MSERGGRGLELALVGGLFCLSGGAALVYQVAWQRILALHTGVGVYSVATIVAAFMLGLGLGSEWGGKLSARLSAKRALLAFAAAETPCAFRLADLDVLLDLLAMLGRDQGAHLGRFVCRVAEADGLCACSEALPKAQRPETLDLVRARFEVVHLASDLVYRRPASAGALAERSEP